MNSWNDAAAFNGQWQRQSSSSCLLNFSSITLTLAMFSSHVHIVRHFALLLSMKPTSMFNIGHCLEARFVHCKVCFLQKYLATNQRGWWGHGRSLWRQCCQQTTSLHCVMCWWFDCKRFGKQFWTAWNRNVNLHLFPQGSVCFKGLDYDCWIHMRKSNEECCRLLQFPETITALPWSSRAETQWDETQHWHYPH